MVSIINHKKHLIMKIANQMWLALMLLPMLCACQADDIEGIQEEIPETPTVEVEPVTIKASLPGGDKSRAQVKYGNPNGKAGEFFMWNDDDVITVYNYTKIKANATGFGNITGTKFAIGNINGNNADFTATKDFAVESGDVLIALYGNNFTYRTTMSLTQMIDISNETTSKQEKKSTYDDSELKHLQDEIKMYDIVKVGDDGKIPELHFKHLSALIRVTVYNAKEESLAINKIKFSYGENHSFPDDITYKINAGDEVMLKYDCSSGYYKGLGCEYESGKEITLASHETYDLFFAFTPYELDNESSTLNITLNDGFSTDIEGFKNIPFKPGYRYWFDLTLTDDGLKETSQLGDYYWYNHPKSANEYVLSSVKDLREFANLVNGTASGVDEAVDFQDKTVKIATGVNTLDLNKGPWTPIGTKEHPFKGIFDGDGCHIANLNVEQDGDYAGLFGYVDGRIQNLRVSGTVKSDMGNNVGGIAGYGKVQWCIFNGEVSGNEYVGGICGKSSSNPYYCYTTGSVTGNNTVGGVVGTGSVSFSYSAADVKGNSNIGGIVGNGNATTCYATGKVTAKEYGGGIVGNPNSSDIQNNIALNPRIERSEGTNSNFGRVGGENSFSYKECYAYERIEMPEGITILDLPTYKDGGNLSSADCLNPRCEIYRKYFTTWEFDPNTTWEYLPWHKVFENFRGIQPEDYRIKVPEHLKPAK